MITWIFSRFATCFFKVKSIQDKKISFHKLAFILLISTVISNTCFSQAMVEEIPIPTVTVNEVVQAGDSLVLQASTTGNRQDISYIWRIIDAPEGSNTDLFSLTILGPLFVPDRVGIYIIEVVATDGSRISDSVFPSSVNGSDGLMTPIISFFSVFHLFFFATHLQIASATVRGG